MRLKKVLQLFDMLEEFEIYAIPHKNYPDSFCYEENIDVSKPIFKGMAKDIPYWLLECYLNPSDGDGPALETRPKEGSHGCKIVCAVRDPQFDDINYPTIF